MEDELLVSFHQALLSLAQKYKSNITQEQREALLEVNGNRGHHLIAPEVKRELVADKLKVDPNGEQMDIE